MSAPAAKFGDKIVGMDTHYILAPSPAGPILTPTLMCFEGPLSEGLSTSVAIDNKPAATIESAARAVPPHVPVGGTFQKPPANRGSVMNGSTSVFIDDRSVARAGDSATTCNDPVDAPNGVVVATGTVFVGG